MRVTAQAVIACGLIAGFVYVASRPPPQLESHFSDCTAAIVRELEKAQHSVHVQAYSLTSAPIAKALVDANRRGAKVIVIADATNRSTKYSAADFLAHEAVETYIDSQHAIAHNKIMIVDGRIVMSGSSNFTRAAEKITPKIFS